MWEAKLDKRKSLIGLLLIMALALGLRLMSIGRDSLWLDEAISYLTANLSATDIFNNIIESPHPPFYYLLLHYWQKFFPDNDTVTRFLSAFLNLLLIPIIYRLTRDLLGRYSLALLAALFIAISPFQIAYSHELRMYTLLILLVTLTVWTYWKAFHDGNWYWWLLFFLSALLAMYSHFFSFFVLAAIGIYALINYRNRRALIMTTFVGLALAVLFLPWLYVIVNGAEYGTGSLRPLHNSDNNPIKSIIVFTFLLFGHSTNLWYSGAALFLTVAILIIFVMEMRRGLEEGQAQAVLFLVLLVLCTIGLPVIIYHIRPFFLPERTMAAASPFLIILLAWAVTRRHSPLPYLVMATAFIMFAGSLVYLFSEAQKPPYREVIQFVAQNRKAGDVVLHTSDGSYLPALRYEDFPDHVLLAGDPDPRKTIPVYQILGGEVWERETAVQAGQRLWVIVALEHSYEWQQVQSQSIADEFTLLEEQDIGGINVYLYDLTKSR